MNKQFLSFCFIYESLIIATSGGIIGLNFFYNSSALLILIAMIVYTAKAPLPRTVDRNRNPYVTREFKIRFGYSYILGWAGLLLTFMAGIIALMLHRKEVGNNK